MEFKISVFDPATVAKKLKEAKGPTKWEEEGITVARYMFHPDCPFCGLRDGGREASARPDEKHMQNCTKRTLTHKPFTESNGVRGERNGTCVGEGAPISVRYPIRLIRAVPVAILDAIGIPTGEVETKFYCSYKWKMWQTADWIWSGKRWIPWFEWSTFN